MVRRLADGSAHTIHQLSQDFGITRQGARKQIQVLVSANVVYLKPAGRETLVALDPAALEIAHAFITRMEHLWDKRLLALKQFVEK
jgi:DNA-binding IclR family transcriptional regulator